MQYALLIFFLLVSSVHAESILIKPVKVTRYNFYETYNTIAHCKNKNNRIYSVKYPGKIDFISPNKLFQTGQIILSIDKEITLTSLNKAKTALNIAQDSYQNDLSLFNNKIINNQILDKSKLNLENTKLDLLNAQKKYDQMVIKAPFEGNIDLIQFNLGDYVKAGDYLFTLVGNNKNFGYIDLPESIYDKINKDTLILTKDNIKATIDFISNHTSNTGLIKARIIFSEDANIIHNSYKEIELRYNNHIGIALPQKAILRDNTGSFIYKITKDNKAKKTYIKTLTRTDNMQEIVPDELKIGELVVFEGLTKIYDDALVNIDYTRK